MNKESIFRILHFLVMLLLLSVVSCKKTSPPDYTGQKGTVTDLEGNVYQTIGIGTQIWMAENLKTTKYNDGTAITLIKVGLPQDAPAYWVFKNDTASNKFPYGNYYNWYAAASGKLAPKGWHVPSYDELMTLVNYLGGQESAGGKMKTIGTVEDGSGLWHTPNIGATNSSGFTGLPGSYISDSEGESYYNTRIDSLNIGREGFWCTTTTYSQSLPQLAWSLFLQYYESDVMPQWVPKYYLFSIRCIKD